MTSRTTAAAGFHRALAGLGGILQLVAGLWVAASGLVAPPWGVGVLAAAWILITWWAVRHWRDHPLATIGAFVATAAFWVGFVLTGEFLFGFGA